MPDAADDRRGPAALWLAARWSTAHLRRNGRDLGAGLLPER
ncbi:MAG: hypothetical protein ABSG50_04265 [Opitutaceae bacterium]